MGSGTALETLRLTDRSRASAVCTRAACTRGSSANTGFVRVPARLRGRRHAAARGVRRAARHRPHAERFADIERDVRGAAYEVRDLKGSAVQGIGLTVSGFVHALAHEVGALIPVSVRVGEGVCASLPCVLGPDGPSAPLWPQMIESERAGWEHSLEVLARRTRDCRSRGSAGLEPQAVGDRRADLE